MELSPQGIIAYVTGYIGSMPADIMQGDVFALTITLIAFFIAVVLINRLTGLLILFLKKAILFIIVTLAFWQFFIMFFARVSVEGLTTDTLIFGAAGFIIGFIAISIALYVALHTFYESRKVTESAAAADQPITRETTRTPDMEIAASEPPTVSVTSIKEDETAAAGVTRKIAAMKDSLSVSNLKNDKSLGAVLAYLVIAQFGVFSSKTMPAPSFQVGIAFFVIFIIAGLVFIHFTYNNYLTGLRHLIMAIIIGTVIAIILGYFWGNIPLDVLLSPAFFQTDALVALVTGLALSLFMGGKG